MSMSDNFDQIGAAYFSIAQEFSRDPYPSVVAACYVTSEAYARNKFDVPNLADFLFELDAPSLIRDFVLDKLEPHWDDWRKLLRRFNPDEVWAYCIEMHYDRDDYRATTPPSIAKLCTRLLDVRPNDFFADFGSGIGEVLNCAFLEQRSKCDWLDRTTDNPHCKSWSLLPGTYRARGIEVNRELAAISAIKTYLLTRDPKCIRIADVFEYDPLEVYDKIFCCPPWGLRSWKMLGAKRFLAKHYPALPDEATQCSGEWLFALRAMTSLSDHGTAIVATTNGAMFNRSDETIRRYFLERGWIKAVISLPERCFSDTGISTALLVLSYGNKSVRFVDASEGGTSKRWLTTFTDKQINALAHAVSGQAVSPLNAGDMAVEVILKSNAVLFPPRVLRKPLKVANGVPLGRLAKAITRGGALGAAERAELTTTRPTGYRYLSVGDIQDGRIVKNLSYLTQIPRRHLSHCVRDGDLIVTKTGKPFKAAVVRVPDNTVILIGSNLLAVSLDQTKADADFLAAFLSSEAGLEQLAARSVGSALPTIGSRELRETMVPCPPLEQQRQTAKAYRAKLDEIAYLKDRIARIRDEIGALCEMTAEG
jgi:type I restriction enzyme M protein